MEDDFVKRAAAIAEFVDTSIFVPERDERGEEAPPEWFGMNPDHDEDSAEVIGSSTEEGDGRRPATRRRCQKSEPATSLNSTEPPTTSRAQPRRLSLETIKPSLPSRPRQRPTLPPRPRPQTRLLLHRRLPCLFICLVASQKTC